MQVHALRSQLSQLQEVLHEDAASQSTFTPDALTEAGTSSEEDEEFDPRLHQLDPQTLPASPKIPKQGTAGSRRSPERSQVGEAVRNDLGPGRCRETLSIDEREHEHCLAISGVSCQAQEGSGWRKVCQQRQRPRSLQSCCKPAVASAA